nr:immunoglobulin light chain junction region [Macaca mulatta]MOX78620.1 immunoglobulin light chain junction region [Macaca mulatta]MOX79479.1 immunoglobulin light chain junction region [Macaca mulatta]MOX80108.1 immunoglobulin light chain junction region [Macaca mulatta]MOX81090.1 immunoglobulin light chain junction region [Macaca mulatta]
DYYCMLYMGRGISVF